jgi:choline kinase
VSAIRTAIVLAAGGGTRLRERTPSKPLASVAGTPLIDHALARLAAVGIARAIVVTGYRADEVEAHLAGRPSPLAVETVRTPDWQLPNGVSARAAGPRVGTAPALLLMCDHLVEPALYARIAETGLGGDALRLGIDRRLGHPWVDPDDVTCVATEDDRIVAIGKHLAPHDAYDTGVFAVGSGFFDALTSLEAPSITDAVRMLAASGIAATIECSDLDWIDVDDARALDAAEAWLTRAAA